MLAGVTDCRRSRKWGCRGRLAQGFKPRLCSRTKREDHMALAEGRPRGSDTADGAGTLNYELLLLFLRYGTPDWVEEEGRIVHLWVF